jgi:hypothetical protein
MLDCFPRHLYLRTCEGLHRRAFLKVGALAGLGLALPATFAHKQALAREGRSSRTHNVYVSDDVAATIYTKPGIPLSPMRRVPPGREPVS